MQRLFWRSLLIIVPLIGPVMAQPVTPTFKRIDVDQGLSQNSVFSIYQDSRGFMWFGTADGLNRYDGERVEVFKADNPVLNLANSNFIRRTLCEDRSGRIWYANETGIYFFDPLTETIKSVSANKEGYFFYSQRFDVPQATRFQEIRKDIELKPIEKGAKVVLNNIFFETGKATLTPQSRLELERAVDLLRTNPKMIIEVGGHTDNVGDDHSNMKLSHDRAKSVRDYLVNAGISSEKVQAKGYGELNPVATNDTEDGRKANRRTEFIILDY